MKMKLSLFCIALVTLIVSCANGTGKTETNSTWTEERKNKEIANCITSMMFKKANDSLPEATKKAVCECSVITKMARYPDAEKANINMAGDLGVDKMMTFRDSCIAVIIK